MGAREHWFRRLVVRPLWLQLRLLLWLWLAIICTAIGLVVIRAVYELLAGDGDPIALLALTALWPITEGALLGYIMAWRCFKEIAGEQLTRLE